MGIRTEGETHAGRNVPFFLVVIESHDFVGTDACLPLAGTDG